MAITTLDPGTALIVIDLQKGLVALPTVHPIAGILSNVGALAAVFRERGLPVVLVNVDGRPPGRTEQARSFRDLPADWSELVPELDRQPRDHVVTKRTAGAFTNTGLHDYLKGRGVTQVVVTGIATSMGVESTVRQAHELGFNVTVAVDATTDLDADAHTNSVTRIFPRVSETGTTRDILGFLNAIAPTPERHD